MLEDLSRTTSTFYHFHAKHAKRFALRCVHAKAGLQGSLRCQDWSTNRRKKIFSETGGALGIKNRFWTTVAHIYPVFVIVNVQNALKSPIA